MIFGDKVNFGDNNEIKANLEKIQKDLNRVKLTIEIKNRDDYLAFAIQNILLYSAKQVEQLSIYLEGPIDFISWKARNLFEAYLLCEYLVQFPAQAKVFIGQIAVDELQINEGFLGINATKNSDIYKKIILDRNEYIRSTLNKHKLKETGFWTVSFLAKAVDCQDEYTAFFKLYSKYVHPSSWIINGQESQYDTLVFRNVFILQAQYYLSRLLKTTENYQKSENK